MGRDPLPKRLLSLIGAAARVAVDAPSGAGDARAQERLLHGYEVDTRRRVARYEGRRTAADRLDDRLTSLEYHLLPHYFANVPPWRLRLRSLGGPRTLPDFACVGPIKSGTSDLATYLFQHPSILAPLAKEVTTRRVEDWSAYYPTALEKARVEREHGKALAGYFNPVLHSVVLMDALHRMRPDAKIVLMLRNPTDRAYSHYKWELLNCGRQLLESPYYRSFGACVDAALAFFPAVPFPSSTRFELLQLGIYAKAVELWRDRFGRENVLVLRAEDFFADVSATVRQVHAFLGVRPIEPRIHPIVNQNPIAAPPFEEGARRKLQAFYRPYNEQLYELIGRDMKWA